MKKTQLKTKKSTFFLKIFIRTYITFFGAKRRKSEENKKDAPDIQLSKYVFRFFRTFSEK